MAGDVRHRGGGGQGLRPSCLRHERTHRCPQLPT
ncbi:unnamed protein product [Linum tenue]|uniref:Uncharacterized protein n=1 Tax=Linum tenue TaxID=586396 RepID=A0AAV0NI00_9ROSI|nr:unnamed protein product [Linum tenue]